MVTSKIEHSRPPTDVVEKFWPVPSNPVVNVDYKKISRIINW